MITELKLEKIQQFNMKEGFPCESHIPGVEARSSAPSTIQIALKINEVVSAVNCLIDERNATRLKDSLVSILQKDAIVEDVVASTDEEG